MAGGTRSYEMARRLVAKGHDVNMVTSWREDDGKNGWFQTEEDGIRVHWLPVAYANRMEFGDRIKAFVKFAWGAARKAASLPADIVFATSTPLTIALPGIYAARRQRVPFVFEVRDLWPELPIAVGALKNPILIRLARWLERYAYSQAEHIFALSPGMKHGIEKIGYPSKRITVIPNSADLELFDPRQQMMYGFRKTHPELGDNPLVVYTGTMGKINKVAYMAQIAEAAALQKLPLQFVVIGGGQEEPLVRDSAKALGVLGKNFHMYPVVPKKQVPSILFDAALALSLFDDIVEMSNNSANKFFDALASGTPVAINYGGWQADLLNETGAGIVLPPNNPEQAARMIHLFLSDFTLNGKASLAARRLAEEKFDREKLAQEMESVLVTAVSRHRIP